MPANPEISLRLPLLDFAEILPLHTATTLSMNIEITDQWQGNILYGMPP